MKSVFNRHLSKDESEPLYGFIGSKSVSEYTSQDIYLSEDNLERQLNSLDTLVYAKSATEEKVMSWAELLQKLVLTGVSYEQVDQWLKTDSFNLMPPIDIDKFSNFNEYFWIGQWLLDAPSLPYHELGIPADAALAALAVSNPSAIPEYYVIKRGELDELNQPTSSVPGFETWSDWAKCNLWIHRDEALEFQSRFNTTLRFSSLSNATLPIIEFSNLLKLNTHVTAAGLPIDDGGLVRAATKQNTNQPPLFDLYTHDSKHTGLTSAIFYYQEGSNYPLDARVQRRLAVDENSDYIFNLGIKLPTTDELLWYKLWNGESYDLATVWVSGGEASASYVKLDTSGTIFNHDKFTNFKNYYWVSPTNANKPAYNPLGLAEYYVIEAGGNSDWSLQNHWVHVANLDKNSLFEYVQAQQPIIEFNLSLETELKSVKTKLNQVPEFKLYSFDQLTSTYQAVGPSTQVNDAHTMGCLLARLDDLDLTKYAIASKSELRNQLFSYADSEYVQSFVNGYFTNVNEGVSYGFTTVEVGRNSNGNGQLSIAQTADDAVVQVYKLTAISGTTFEVVSSVMGQLPPLVIGTPYESYGSSFTLIAGTVPFVAGDTIWISVRSVVYKPVQLYVNLNGAYRTFAKPEELLTKDSTATAVITATPSLRNGVWSVPEQLTWNVENETRTVLKQGDLVYHFGAIINAQPGLVGSSNGSNNFRSLTAVNLGLGGTIKQFNGRFGLLVGLLMQEGVTPTSLLDFSTASYERMLGKIQEYVEQYLIADLHNGLTVPQANSLPSQVLAKLIAFIETSGADVYYDTTMPIKGCSATLPYMGLMQPTQPVIKLDDEQAFMVQVHHDGHKTKLIEVNDQVLKNLVKLEFPRSSGQVTAGIVGTSKAPTAVFARQLWLDLTSMSLYMYNVVDDIGTKPSNVDYGTFAYDRNTGQVWCYNGSWVLVGNDEIAQEQPWVKLDLSLIAQNALLGIEQLLYKHCPVVPLRGQVNLLDVSYNTMMQREFEQFASKHNIADPYAVTYQATNPFTWNYTGTGTPYLPIVPASWHAIYTAVYGTSRPDLYPWISCGFVSETAFLTTAIVGGALPNGTTKFVPATMWTAVAELVRNRLALQGKPSVLSVDTSTGELIPPFAFGHDEQLFAVQPPTPMARYGYNEYGPIELLWRGTTAFATSVAKVAYMQNPLQFVHELWGDAIKVVNGYEFSANIGRKQAPDDIPLHGAVINRQVDSSVLTLSNVTPSLFDRTITIEVVSVSDKKVRMTEGANVGFASFSFISVGLFNATLTEPKDGLSVGDKFVVTVTASGKVTVAIEPATTVKLNGLGQLYTHQHRFVGADLQQVANTNWLLNWTTKLGYRVNNFVDADTLKVQVEDVVIDPSAYSVLLKETPYVSKATISALQVTLLQVGSTEWSNGKSIPAKPYAGQRGDDWVFYIKGFHPDTNLEWYQYDTTAEYNTFFALNGANTLDEWRRYTVRTNLIKAKSPFVVTGLQNLVTFIYGFVDRLTEKGFVFNDVENPVLDETTGRMLDWQLQIEQLIDQQFGGVVAGSSFMLNPFSSKLWFKTDYGFLANLAHPSTVLGELTPALYNINEKHLAPGSFRVFRTDEISELAFDDPLYAATLLVSAHEHVMLFDAFAGLDTLLYDSFLGQRVKRLFITGEKQVKSLGRVSYGGKFLQNGQMRKNMEAGVNDILKLYDSSNPKLNTPEVQQTRAMLGFETKDYWRDRNAPEQTEFRFWQGAVKGKGTNFAVNAYLNSKSYKTASIDEYWAYKVAQYGDARQTKDVELRIEPNDCPTERTNYLFLESDELSLLQTWTKLNGYDVPRYDITPYDASTLYLASQVQLMEPFETNGSVIIRSDDESRWYRYNDLNQVSYFEADVIAEVILTPTSLNDVYVLRKIDGSLVYADCFEVVDASAIEGSDLYDMLPYDTAAYEGMVNQIYREVGDYIPGSSPIAFEAPKFKRIGHSTIQFIDPICIGRPMKVICYGPPLAKFSPTQLYSYQKQDVRVRTDLVWWDPARGVHHPQASAAVDYEQATDPARYNNSNRLALNKNIDGMRVWGANEVGKVWWDTTKRAWLPYNDTKLYPSMTDRLARWGGLADDASIDVYEWVEASVPPAQWAANVEAGLETGEAAVKELISRTRTWQQRIVMWLSSDNPQLQKRAPLSLQTARLTPVITNGKGLLVASNGALPEISVGSQLGAVKYSTIARSASDIIQPFGLYEITADAVQHIIGSSTDFTTPKLVSTAYFTNLAVELDEGLLQFIGSAVGTLTFGAEVEDGIDYLRVTLASGKTQRIEVPDTPMLANAKLTLVFDQLGVTLSVNAVYGQGDSWGSLGIRTMEQRKQLLASSLGASGNSIVVREAIPVVERITPRLNSLDLSFLPGPNDISLNGWAIWKIPADLQSDNVAPFNKYEPVYGEWLNLGLRFNDAIDKIKYEQQAPLLTKSGEVINSYRSVWSNWSNVRPTVREACFFKLPNVSHDQRCKQLFAIPTSKSEVKVYVNGYAITQFKLVVIENTTSQYVYIAESALSHGAMVKIVVEAYTPTAEELKFDPTAPSADPSVLTMYSMNTPYSKYEDRNEQGRVVRTRYYYWVKNREAAVYGKNVSCKRVAELLRSHDDMYCVPQVLKFYNPIDGRPNRYGLLSIKNLARYVRKASNYKLRIRGVYSARNDDKDMNLKNIHEEWKLLRPAQTSKIPKELWDKLVDTLCGETAFGQPLPYIPYSAYDERNASAPPAGYGIGVGQVLTDSATAIATVKGTILNTRVTMYDGTSGEVVLDPIRFTGFDIAKLDTYFTSTDAIREFMSNVWRLAKAKQINELFFAVLDDSLARTKELAGIFKTSYVSLNEVRTVAVDQLGG
jgi:hypothetical protein